ncbi:MAG: hypothetical protein MH204_08810 [Fimbriimonadaceae bacterium]|nr:hypothetical protein [Fimbriimonadaceae bacterium]
MFFVVAADGEKYGPADLETLKAWAADHRLAPGMMLEDAVSGARIRAEDLPGLFASTESSSEPPPQATPPAQPQMSPPQDNPAPGPNYTQSPYDQVRLQSGPISSNTQGLEISVWVLGTISLCFCPICLGPISITCAVLAQKRGNPRGLLLIGFAIAMMLIGMILGFVTLINNPELQELLRQGQGQG